MDWHHPDGARCATGEAARQRLSLTRMDCSRAHDQLWKIDVLWYDVDWPLTARQLEIKKMNDMVFQSPDIIVKTEMAPGRFLRQ
jgi:alpha-L-fucosidase